MDTPNLEKQKKRIQGGGDEAAVPALGKGHAVDEDLEAALQVPDLALWGWDGV